MKALELMKHYLDEEGYKYKESESSLAFRFEGHSFNYYKNNSEGQFFQIATWYNDSIFGEDPELTLKAANQVNFELGVVKIIFDPNDNTICSSWEMLVNDETPYQQYFEIIEHGIHFILKAVHQLFEKLETK